MRQSTIYNFVTVLDRKTDKSFGTSHSFSQSINVGTSSINSHSLAVLHIKQEPWDNGTTTRYTLKVNGVPIMRGILDGKTFTHDWVLRGN